MFRTIALLRYHASAGGRVAQRALLPVLGTFLFLYAVLGPVFFQDATAAWIGEGYLASALPALGVILATVLAARRRVADGLTGWMRHLPAGEAARRHAAAVSLTIAALPVLVLLTFLTLTAAYNNALPAAPLLAGLIPAAMAASVFVLPVSRRWSSRPLLAVACLCYLSMDWRLLGAGLAFHALGDLRAGPLAATVRRAVCLRGRMLDCLILWRAQRLRILFPYLLSFSLYLWLYLFLANNPFQPLAADMAVRLCAAMSLVVFCAVFSHMAASRRPVWPWFRSLPQSARQRVSREALCLLAHVSPLALFALVFRAQTVWPVLICLPGLVLFSLGAERGIRSGRFGVFGRVLGHAGPPALLLGLTAWAAPVILLATPWLRARAEEAERSLDVSAWRSARHFAEGDSHTWRGV